MTIPPTPDAPDPGQVRIVRGGWVYVDQEDAALVLGLEANGLSTREVVLTVERTQRLIAALESRLAVLTDVTEGDHDPAG